MQSSFNGDFGVLCQKKVMEMATLEKKSKINIFQVLFESGQKQRFSAKWTMETHLPHKL